VNDSFYEELELVLDKFPIYYAKIFLEDFSSEIGKEDIYKLTIGTDDLHEISNDNGVVNFAKSNKLTVENTMFPHHNIHKYTWTSPDGKPRNQVVHFLINNQSLSSALDARSFRATDCNNDHYLVEAAFRGRLAINKKKIHIERSNLKKLC
jgi:hypothetical protein